MWSATGRRTERAISANDPRYSRWLAGKMARGEAVAFIAHRPDGGRLGSGCVWLRETHPRPALPERIEAYILSVYTAPEARRQGVASAIVTACLRAARTAGAARVSLHASTMGRSAYARLGFERTWEMRVWIDPARQARVEHTATPGRRKARTARR